MNPSIESGNNLLETMSPQIETNLIGYSAEPVTKIAPINKVSREEKLKLLEIASRISYVNFETFLTKFEELVAYVETW